MMGFNFTDNRYLLVLAALLTSETGEIYTKFYNILKLNFNFNPKLISCDFGIGNIKGFKDVFRNQNEKIITCFFHLSQSWWKRANTLGLWKKKYLNDKKYLYLIYKGSLFYHMKKVLNYIK